ncbi:MAG: MmgE/PrpD family protein [Anaerolineales bacterium]|nr:MAG: MmgE/PrpD family protein [Anaerolineales bacterium]
MEANTNSEIKVTEEILDFILQADIQHFPQQVIQQGKHCLLDGMGVILSGSTAACSVILRDFIKSLRGVSEATVLGRGAMRVPASLAALANGTSGHAMDFDDTQLSTSPDRIFGLLTHPTIPPLAASLAVGERTRASGLEFLEAFLTGFEVECKIAEAIDPSHYAKGFHTSGTIGTFGATASAAKLMGLEKAQVAKALGIAASLASGIRVNFGTMTKPLHVGRAAENGVVASDLASRGFSADMQALDGPWGFFQVFGGGYAPEKIVGCLGNPHTIVDPGISVKPYPCGVLGHPSMDAMLKLMLEHNLRPEQIQAIRLKAGSNLIKPLRYGKAKNALEAKFSLPFMLSSIAVRRRAGVKEFTDEFVQSQPVQRMMDKVEIVFDPEIEAKGFDKIRSVVEVRLQDGQCLVQAADEKYRGGPERPFTSIDLHQKFEECAESVLQADDMRRAIALIESVDQLASIEELVEVLAASNDFDC